MPRLFLKHKIRILISLFVIIMMTIVGSISLILIMLTGIANSSVNASNYPTFPANYNPEGYFALCSSAGENIANGIYTTPIVKIENGSCQTLNINKPIYYPKVPFSTNITNTSCNGVSQPPQLFTYSNICADNFNGANAFGQCVWWAAYNWDVPTMPKNDLLPKKLTASDYANTSLPGVTEGIVPKVGSLVVYGKGNGYDPNDGHIAVILAVSNNNQTFIVSEMNYNEVPGQLDVRLSTMHDVLDFIYLPVSIANTASYTVASPSSKP